jgi:hypothetical protein
VSFADAASGAVNAAAPAMTMVIESTHAGIRAIAPDVPERFDNRSATFSVISVSPSFRLADRSLSHVSIPTSDSNFFSRV